MVNTQGFHWFLRYYDMRADAAYFYDNISQRQWQNAFFILRDDAGVAAFSHCHIW